MRTAVVSWSSRRVGGVEDYLCLLMPALGEAGHEVAFWHEVDTPGDRGRIPLPHGAADICAAADGVDVALRRLREWKPDVLYVQGLADVATEGRLLEIAPAVFFLHTYIGTCISGRKTFSRTAPMPCSRTFGAGCLVRYFPRGCGGKNPLTMVRLYGEQGQRLRTLRRYEAIMTHSDHMRVEMRKHGLHAEVIPYPVGTRTDADLERPSPSRRLLFAGRMESLKGGNYLIEALPRVVASVGQRLHVVLAGDGPDRARWEARANTIAASTPGLTIEFVGWLSQERVGSLMKTVDLLVVPSIWPEPFGAVGPAAAHHGVPAAAFASGGICQWLVDGVSGHLASGNPPTPAGLADAIVKCIRDPAHHRALQTGARAVSEQFTMNRHLPLLIDRLHAAAGARRS